VAQPNFRKFLSRFKDAFGGRITPTVLLISPDFEAVVPTPNSLPGFRDLVALSVVPFARARAVGNGAGWGVRFSNSFGFYPWMIAKDDGERVVCDTPAELGLHNVDEFRGQSTPGLSQVQVSGSDLDAPLFNELKRRWQSHFQCEDPTWEGRALFRSLNMANQACMMPTGASDTTLYDVGRLIGLWVSAFEILVHPGPGGKSGQYLVMDALDGAAWLLPAARRRVHQVRQGKGTVRRTLASFLYSRLHDARNHFLHGNSIEAADLKTAIPGITLFHIAAPLYRMALSAFLGLAEPPLAHLPGSASEAEALGAAIALRRDFRGYQEIHEEALIAAIRGRPRRAPPRVPRAKS
jgi:hypothetical protein